MNEGKGINENEKVLERKGWIKVLMIHYGAVGEGDSFMPHLTSWSFAVLNIAYLPLARSYASRAIVLWPIFRTYDHP